MWDALQLSVKHRDELANARAGQAMQEQEEANAAADALPSAAPGDSEELTQLAEELIRTGAAGPPADAPPPLEALQLLGEKQTMEEKQLEEANAAAEEKADGQHEQWEQQTQMPDPSLFVLTAAGHLVPSSAAALHRYACTDGHQRQDLDLSGMAINSSAWPQPMLDRYQAVGRICGFALLCGQDMPLGLPFAQYFLRLVMVQDVPARSPAPWYKTFEELQAELRAEDEEHFLGKPEFLESSLEDLGLDGGVLCFEHVDEDDATLVTKLGDANTEKQRPSELVGKLNLTKIKRLSTKRTLMKRKLTKEEVDEAEAEVEAEAKAEAVVAGADVVVTDENKAEFAQLWLQHRLVDSIREQARAFHRGLEEVIPSTLLTLLVLKSFPFADPAVTKVIPADLLKLFSVSELQAALGGARVDDDALTAWRERTKVEEEAEQAAELFWAWMAAQTHDIRAQVLAFATGSTRLPQNLAGWKFHIETLTEPMVIAPTADNGLAVRAACSSCGANFDQVYTSQTAGCADCIPPKQYEAGLLTASGRLLNGPRIPTASTCAFTIRLPAWRNAEECEEAMRWVLTYGDGFGII